MNKTCQSCQFAHFPWDPIKGEFLRGDCRRHAPVGVPRTCPVSGSVTTKAEWPEIDTEKWCGDYIVTRCGWRWDEDGKGPTP